MYIRRSWSTPLLCTWPRRPVLIYYPTATALLHGLILALGKWHSTRSSRSWNFTSIPFYAFLTYYLCWAPPGDSIILAYAVTFSLWQRLLYQVSLGLVLIHHSPLSCTVASFSPVPYPPFRCTFIPCALYSCAPAIYISATCCF